MSFISDPKLREVLRQVAIALLLALLSGLGYDQAVIKPRLARAMKGRG